MSDGWRMFAWLLPPMSAFIGYLYAASHLSGLVRRRHPAVWDAVVGGRKLHSSSVAYLLLRRRHEAALRTDPDVMRAMWVARGLILALLFFLGLSFLFV